MSAENLSETRISVEVRAFAPGNLPLIEQVKIVDMEEQLKNVVVDYNFDTFSFLFELLQKAEEDGLPLSAVFETFEIDTVNLAEKYQGTNCTGLSMLLQRNLREQKLETTLVPAYGNYLITEAADEYAEVRTVDLVGLMQRDLKSQETIFLAPGLTIDKPIFVREGFQVESYGNQYIITRSGEESFEVASVKPDGDIVRRDFFYQEVTNPNQSLQKNLIRARTRYQMTRQHKDGRRDFVTFDFPRRIFRVSVEGKTLDFDIENFKSYVLGNSEILGQVFRNPHFMEGFSAFADNVDSIKNELLLPEIQHILSEIWKSS